MWEILWNGLINVGWFWQANKFGSEVKEDLIAVKNVLKLIN
jgi:hypothetical protein